MTTYINPQNHFQRFAPIPAPVLKADLTASEMVVFGVLAMLHGMTDRPSLTEIQKEVNLSRATVKRAVNGLVKKNHLERISPEKPEQFKWKTCRYRFIDRPEYADHGRDGTRVKMNLPNQGEYGQNEPRTRVKMNLELGSNCTTKTKESKKERNTHSDPDPQGTDQVTPTTQCVCVPSFESKPEPEPEKHQTAKPSLTDEQKKYIAWKVGQVQPRNPAGYRKTLERAALKNDLDMSDYQQDPYAAFAATDDEPKTKREQWDSLTMAEKSIQWNAFRDVLTADELASIEDAQRTAEKHWKFEQRRQCAPMPEYMKPSNRKARKTDTVAGAGTGDGAGLRYFTLDWEADEDKRRQELRAQSSLLLARYGQQVATAMEGP
jgi:hypothetical protein